MLNNGILWDILGATCHKRPCAYVNFWVGVGGMLTFLAFAHMLDATQDAGLGWGGCKRSLHLRTCWMLRKMLGWGGGDVDIDLFTSLGQACKKLRR